MATDVQIVARRVASVNPATGEVLREFAAASESEVHAAVEGARAAQHRWSQIGIEDRIRAMRKFQQLLHAQATDVARVITSEAGKPVVEALLTEVMVVLDAARFCIENVYRFLRDQPLAHGNPAMKTKAGRIVREPYGVIGIISPWNYPFSIPSTETIAALATGNAVVLKPSELTSLSALKLASLMHEAGVPEDVFQVIVGDGGTGAALFDAKIDKLVFTGSVATGKRIAQAAATRLLPVVLELGGKDPMIVLDDADIDVASSGAIWGAFVNAGQTCLSVERCYVHRRVYEKFLDACLRKTKKLRVGSGLDENTDVGPLINERQLRIVEAQVQDALSRGARLMYGGSRLPELGPNFYAPTVMADVTHDMKVMREETFGPVLPVMAFDNDDQAIDLANDSEYGLGASVWTSNRRRGNAFARRIQAGIVMINDAVSCFGISEAPHGGVKASGVGRTHGRFGLDEMVRVKYVSDDRLPGLKKIWWYGYGDSLRPQMEGFLDVMFARGWSRRLRGGLRSTGALTRKERI
jgi:succinate-semialdehyde dehydrogenase/glutarate-semialdehyde dehydrogenase